MKKLFLSTVLAALLLSLFFNIAYAVNISTTAPCKDSPERKQLVYLDWGDEAVAIWEANTSEMYQTTLPNNFKIGVTIDDSPPVLDEWSVESVQIRIFDLQTDEPKLVAHNGGGANSIQGYRNIGGARSEEDSEVPGISLYLLKPVCVRKSSLASAR